MFFEDYMNENFQEATPTPWIKKKTFSKGAYLYQPPDMPSRVFEVVSGVVKIGGFSQKGEEVCFDFVAENDVVGYFDNQNESLAEFARAETAVEALSYDVYNYKQMLCNDPLDFDKFVHYLASRKGRLGNRLINNYSLKPVERILNLLQEFDRTATCPKARKVWIPDLFSDKDIAQLTGLSRQTVSKALKSLCYIAPENAFKRRRKSAQHLSTSRLTTYLESGPQRPA